MEDQHDGMGTLQYLTPVEIVAAQISNESLAMLLYVRKHCVQKSMSWYLWLLLSKVRESWSLGRRNRRSYQDYYCKMKSERK